MELKEDHNKVRELRLNKSWSQENWLKSPESVCEQFKEWSWMAGRSAVIAGPATYFYQLHYLRRTIPVF